MLDPTLDPAQAPKPEPPASVKHRREIDLKDGSGVQVFEADSLEGLIDKLASAQENATRKIREQARRLKLGPASDGPELARPLPEFKPRTFTEDERWRLATQIADPSTAPQAIKDLIEAELGLPLEQFRSTVQQTAQHTEVIRAEQEARAFVAETPEYFPCNENTQALTAYLHKNGFACTKRNLKLAYDDLKADGLLAERPQAQVTPVVQPAANPGQGAGIDPNVSVRPRGQASTGLRQEDGAVPVVHQTGPSAREIALMSAAEYRERILLPQMRTARR